MSSDKNTSSLLPTVTYHSNSPASPPNKSSPNLFIRIFSFLILPFTKLFSVLFNTSTKSANGTRTTKGRNGSLFEITPFPPPSPPSRLPAVAQYDKVDDAGSVEEEKYTTPPKRLRKKGRDPELGLIIDTSRGARARENHYINLNSRSPSTASFKSHPPHEPHEPRLWPPTPSSSSTTPSSASSSFPPTPLSQTFKPQVRSQTPNQSPNPYLTQFKDAFQVYIPPPPPSKARSVKSFKSFQSSSSKSSYYSTSTSSSSSGRGSGKPRRRNHDVQRTQATAPAAVGRVKRAGLLRDGVVNVIRTLSGRRVPVTLPSSSRTTPPSSHAGAGVGAQTGVSFSKLYPMGMGDHHLMHPNPMQMHMAGTPPIPFSSLPGHLQFPFHMTMPNTTTTNPGMALPLPLGSLISPKPRLPAALLLPINNTGSSSDSTSSRTKAKPARHLSRHLPPLVLTPPSPPPTSALPPLPKEVHPNLRMRPLISQAQGQGTHSIAGAMQVVGLGGLAQGRPVGVGDAAPHALASADRKDGYLKVPEATCRNGLGYPGSEALRPGFGTASASKARDGDEDDDVVLGIVRRRLNVQDGLGLGRATPDGGRTEDEDEDVGVSMGVGARRKFGRGRGGAGGEDVVGEGYSIYLVESGDGASNGGEERVGGGDNDCSGRKEQVQTGDVTDVIVSHVEGLSEGGGNKQEDNEDEKEVRKRRSSVTPLRIMKKRQTIPDALPIPHAPSSQSPTISKSLPRDIGDHDQSLVQRDQDTEDRELQFDSGHIPIVWDDVDFMMTRIEDIFADDIRQSAPPLQPTLEKQVQGYAEYENRAEQDLETEIEELHELVSKLKPTLSLSSSSSSPSSSESRPTSSSTYTSASSGTDSELTDSTLFAPEFTLHVTPQPRKVGDATIHGRPRSLIPILELNPRNKAVTTGIDGHSGDITSNGGLSSSARDSEGGINSLLGALSKSFESLVLALHGLSYGNSGAGENANDDVPAPQVAKSPDFDSNRDSVSSSSADASRVTPADDKHISRPESDVTLLEFEGQDPDGNWILKRMKVVDDFAYMHGGVERGRGDGNWYDVVRVESYYERR
ncbi:hypothetical protein AX16_007530 [Volvariella volvacea WC 439]|nr:hypothetical protein AX16_007530 [Volvariella volvacea WC 439]